MNEEGISERKERRKASSELQPVANKPYSDHNAGTVAQFAKKHFHSSFVVQSVINAVTGLFDRTV